LDFLCCQGVKTKLVSEFLLKYAFEQIQPRGWCCIVETAKDKQMIGIARSYVYDCLVNGEKSVNAYAFLMRVHPHYRRKNLGIWMTVELYLHDLQTSSVDYCTSWVVADNDSSLVLQEKIAVVGAERIGMDTPDTMGAFRCLGFDMENLKGDFLSHDCPPNYKSSQLIQFIDKPSDQTKIALELLSNRQFLPLDLTTLYEFPLNLGTFVIRNPQTGLPAAILSVWDSGQVRIAYFKDSTFRSDDAVLLYNHWYDESSPTGLILFKILLEHVIQIMSSKGCPFLYWFFPQDLPILSPDVQSRSRINVLWKARVWYTSTKPKIDQKAYPILFYDPRQCLI